MGTCCQLACYYINIVISSSIFGISETNSDKHNPNHGIAVMCLKENTTFAQIVALTCRFVFADLSRSSNPRLY